MSVTVAMKTSCSASAFSCCSERSERPVLCLSLRTSVQSNPCSSHSCLLAYISDFLFSLNLVLQMNFLMCHQGREASLPVTVCQLMQSISVSPWSCLTSKDFLFHRTFKSLIKLISKGHLLQILKTRTLKTCSHCTHYYTASKMFFFSEILNLTVSLTISLLTMNNFQCCSNVFW